MLGTAEQFIKADFPPGFIKHGEELLRQKLIRHIADTATCIKFEKGIEQDLLKMSAKVYFLHPDNAEFALGTLNTIMQLVKDLQDYSSRETLLPYVIQLQHVLTSHYKPEHTYVNDRQSDPAGPSAKQTIDAR